MPSMGITPTRPPAAKEEPPLVLVTGASGFVGHFLCDRLLSMGVKVRLAGRHYTSDNDGFTFRIADITSEAEWKPALKNVSIVIHLAARTHVLNDTVDDPLKAYRSINVAGTAALARQAAACGVRRLIFLSSIKVNGESTINQPFSADCTPAPEDAYGISKLEAEQALRRISVETGIEIVVLRPPLVYGPGVKGNFLRLIDIISRGWPLPLGSIDNQRSLIYVGNLVDAIVTCLYARKASGKTYLVSDSEDLSTSSLIQRIAKALGKRARLLPCPKALLEFGAGLVGKTPAVSRLVGSLRVDSSLIRNELLWRPPITQQEGLRLTAQWYYRQQNK